MNDIDRMHGHLEALLGRAVGVELTEESLDAWLSLAQRNRMLPALHSLVSERGLDSGTTASAFESAVAVQLGVEAAAAAVLEVLAANDIEVRIVKGLATGHLDYPNAAWRQFGDADLYIAPTDFEHALGLLAGAGFHRKYPNLQRDDWRMAHAVPVGVDSFEIDLHHRLLHQAAGHLIGRRDLFEEPEELEVAGRRAFALARPLRLIQAAAQNVVSADASRKWSSDLDVLVLLDLEGLEVDAVQRARKLGLGLVVESGIHRARSLAGYPSEAPRPRSISDLIMWSAHGREQTVLRSGLAEFAVAPMGHKLRAAKANFSPGDAYLESRGRSRSDHLKRQFRRMVGRGPKG